MTEAQDVAQAVVAHHEYKAQGTLQTPPHATEIQRELEARCDEIRYNGRLSEEEKHEQIAFTWGQAQAAYQEAEKLQEEQLSEEVASREKEVFSVEWTKRSDLRSAYADVYDRTAPLFAAGDLQAAREELTRLLERAERTSDSVLADAVYHVATERGERTVADTYLASRPQQKKRWDNYVASRQRLEAFTDPRRRMDRLVAGGGGLAKPPELR